MSRYSTSRLRVLFMNEKGKTTTTAAAAAAQNCLFNNKPYSLDRATDIFKVVTMFELVSDEFLSRTRITSLNAIYSMCHFYEKNLLSIGYH
jgi:hypothetical protein